MASSNASVRAPSQNLGLENIPLESDVISAPSALYDRAASASADPGRLTRPPSTQALPLRAPKRQYAEDKSTPNATLDFHRGVLRRLKAWHQWDTDRYKSLSKFLMSKVGFPKRPIRPSRDHLFWLATYFFSATSVTQSNCVRFWRRPL